MNGQDEPLTRETEVGTAELKGRQQQEAGAELQCHPRLLVAQCLVP